MKRIILAALALSALVGAVIVPAAGAATLGINFGNVSLGFSDGYWDNNHRWHKWGRGELARYRTVHRDTYHAWRHDDRNHR